MIKHRGALASPEEVGAREYDSPLDKGIARYVHVLVTGGIDTFESCEGSEGHSFPEPTVRFHGGEGEGFRALGIAMESGLPVLELRRTWDVNPAGPVGPWWELVFRTTDPEAAP